MRFPGIIPRKLGFGEVVVMQGVIRYFGARGLTTTPTTKTCRWGRKRDPGRTADTMDTDPDEDPEAGGKGIGEKTAE